jgi:hypothetical protein
MGFNLGSTEPGLIGPPFGTCLGVVGLVEPVRAVWLIVRVDTAGRGGGPIARGPVGLGGFVSRVAGGDFCDRGATCGWMSAFGSDLGADLGSGLGAALGSNCGSKEGCACGVERSCICCS